MSRIGILPVVIPSGVNVELMGATLRARGPKGELEVSLLPTVSVTVDDQAITVVRRDDSRDARAQHGLMRTLIANAVNGVNQEFSKQLEINGVGYKANVSGQNITLNLGYSHSQEIKLPPGISAQLENNLLTISGIDKQQVGQVAANIRSLRKPEPYKGKGIKYVGERIIRKAGKAAGAGAK